MLALEQVKAALECRAVASNLLRRLSKSPYRSPMHTITVTRTYFTRHDLDRVPTMFHHGPCRFNARVLDCLRGQLGSPSTCSIPKQSAQQTNLQGVNVAGRMTSGDVNKVTSDTGHSYIGINGFPQTLNGKGHNRLANSTARGFLRRRSRSQGRASLRASRTLAFPAGIDRRELRSKSSRSRATYV
jgi:hypothetical protein